MNVTVNGAPGYEDHFPATLIALVPRVDGSEMMAVVQSANGDWHAFPAKHVHIGDDEPYGVPHIPPVRPVRVGDSIRILQEGLDLALVKAGDVLTVLQVSADGTWFATDAPALKGSSSTWSFSVADQGTGWEIVL